VEVAAKLQSQLDCVSGVEGVKAAVTDANAKHVLEELREALRQEALRCGRLSSPLRMMLAAVYLQLSSNKFSVDSGL
jgi:hypothetical protein